MNMSKNKWSHLNDFRPDESGRYKYEGEFLHYTGDRVRTLLLLWIPSVLSFLLLFGAGFFPRTFIGSHIAAIVGYIAGVILSVVALCKLYSLTSRGEDVPAYVYEKTLKRLPGIYMTSAFMMITSVIASVVLLIMDASTISLINETATIVLRTIAAVLFMFLFFKSRSIELS
jgi:hypothetical protein